MSANPTAAVPEKMWTISILVGSDPGWAYGFHEPIVVWRPDREAAERQGLIYAQADAARTGLSMDLIRIVVTENH